jgi:alkylhydroperoxidase family enzyme
MFIDVPESDEPNLQRAFALRPHVFAAWQQLNGAIKETADLRRYELATLAAARRLTSSYCCLAHGKVLAEQFYDPATVAALPDGLDETDRAIMRFAERVVDDATAITPADVDELRVHGLSDAEITDVVLAAAARCFFSKTLDALGAQPDASYAELPEELRVASVVGRPIEAAR